MLEYTYDILVQYGGRMMENKIVRVKDTRALGITNPETKEEIVEKGLADDERLLTEAFKIFNHEFYDGKLLEPVIHISHSVKKKIGVKVTKSEEWMKRENGKRELCKGLYISDEILNYGVISAGGMKEAYVLLAKGMIILYDQEMKDAYKSGYDVRSEEEKIKGNRRKKRYNGMVTRNGYYYTEEFVRECERIGIIADPIVDDDGNHKGEYNLRAGELFIEVLNKYDLLSRRFVCSKKEKEVKKSNVQDYECPRCEIIVRGTKSGLRIKCCNEEHASEEIFMVELTDEMKKERKLRKKMRR